MVPPVAQTPQKPTPPPYPVTPSPAPAPTTAAPPPAQVAAPAETQQAAHARTPKPIPAAPASNDLKPASGTIEAKPKHAHQLPPTTPPVQVAGEPLAPPSEQTPNPVVTADRAPTPRRARLVARKSVSEHPVRVYIFVGLAIGIGVVLAYWAYWYLPFGHH
ncbi:MAG TPA: hypothetical protein VIM14_18605 [Polyangia bacterium]